MARKPAAKAQQPSPQLVIVGEERDCPLGKVKPNKWNPNKMSAFQFASLEHELRTTGWLRSQKLTVWGKDDKGVVQNLIIDGEHRWRCARKLGIKHAVPMVFIDGITEAEAKKLTLKIRKRGELDPDDLTNLVRELRADADVPSYALDIGIDEAAISRMLSEPDVRREDGLGPKTVARMPKVTLEFSTAEKRDEFKTMLAAACKGKGDKPAGDILAAKIRKLGAQQ